MSGVSARRIAAACAWLEWLRHRTADEFPDGSAHAHGLALEH
jgi:hypothetical protein